MGSSGRVNAAGDPILQALNLVAETIGPYEAGSHFPASSGTFLAVLTYLPAATISTLGCWLHTAGATAGGVNAMSLHTAAGALVDKTGDMSAGLAGSTGWVTGALTGGSQQVAAGAYYVCLLTHFSSNPEIAGSAAVASVPVIQNRYPSVFLTSQASIPASFDPTAATRNSGAYYFTVS